MYETVLTCRDQSAHSVCSPTRPENTPLGSDVMALFCAYLDRVSNRSVAALPVQCGDGGERRKRARRKRRHAVVVELTCVGKVVPTEA